MTPFTIPTKFTAIDGISPVTRQMSGRIHADFTNLANGVAKQERLFRRLTPGIGSATKQLLQYGSAGSLIGGALFSGKEIIDTETAEQSLSAVTGVTGQAFESYKRNIHEVAADTRKSAKDVAGSYEVIGSAMSQYLQDPESLEAISRAGITLSKASRQDLVPTLENLTSIMNQFDIAADKADDTVNRLTAGEIVGSLRTSQLADSMKEVGATAFSSNVTLAESIALLEALAMQMKVDKIGVGARNILTVLDSAKGLDKQARKDLKKAGVDLSLLMNPAKTLGERLKELSKIKGDAVKITSVFGKENKTAANVIFNQLDTYEQYLADIQRTNEAHRQAATNSNTFEVAVDELKNTWTNYLNATEGVHTGLDKMRGGIQYVTDNMDHLIGVGIGAAKVWALWKGAILAQNVALGAYKGTLIATSAIESVRFAKDMVNYVATTQQMTKATAAMAIAQESLNAAWAANPIGIAIGATAALAGGIYLLTSRHQDLLDQYQEEIDLDISRIYDDERQKVDALTNSFEKLNKKKKDAFIQAKKQELYELDEAINKNENAVKADKKNIADTRLNPFRIREHLKNQDKYLEDASVGKVLSTRRAALLKQIEAAQKSGYLNRDEAAGIGAMSNRFQGRVNQMRVEEQKVIAEGRSESKQIVLTERMVTLLEKIAAREERKVEVHVDSKSPKLSSGIRPSPSF